MPGHTKKHIMNHKCHTVSHSVLYRNIQFSLGLNIPFDTNDSLKHLHKTLWLFVQSIKAHGIEDAFAEDHTDRLSGNAAWPLIVLPAMKTCLLRKF